MKHLRVLQVGLSLAILAGMPSVVSAQSGETWMLTYFPVPYASYDNIYMKQSQAGNGITPRFKVGAKQNSFELHLGHNLPNNVSDSLSGTAVLQNTCADIPQTINGETNPAFTTCDNANSNKGATLKFDTDVYTQTATFGSISAPSSAELIFSDLRIANGLGSKDLSTKEITSSEVAVNGKVHMNTSAFTNEAAAALPACADEVHWSKLKFDSQYKWFLTCGDAPTGTDPTGNCGWEAGGGMAGSEGTGNCVLNTSADVNSYYCKTQEFLPIGDILNHSTCGGVNADQIQFTRENEPDPFHQGVDFAQACVDAGCGPADAHGNENCVIYSLEAALPTACTDTSIQMPGRYVLPDGSYHVIVGGFSQAGETVNTNQLKWMEQEHNAVHICHSTCPNN